MIDLQQYVLNGDIWMDESYGCAGLYEMILFDVLPDNTECIDFLLAKGIKVLSFADLGFDTSHDGLIAQELANYSKVCMILSQMTILSVIDILRRSDIDCTCINCHVGLSSIAHKIAREDTDVQDVLEAEIPCFEPFDAVSLLDMCGVPSTTYIRISHCYTDMYLEDVYMHMKQRDRSEDNAYSLNAMVPLTANEGSLAIVTTGRFLQSAISLIEHIQTNNTNMSLDLYLCTDWAMTYLDAMCDRKYASVLVITDQSQVDEIESTLSEYFGKGIKYAYISPTYDTMTTFLDEYIDESGKMDIYGLLSQGETLGFDLSVSK